MMSDEEKDLVKEVGDEADVTPAETEAETPEPAETSVVTANDSMRAGPTANERTWAALAHASVLLTFAVGVSTAGLAVVLAALVPLAIWLAFRDRSRFVAFHAMQATVFQMASLVAWIGLLVVGVVVLTPTWILTALLVFVLVGFLLLPVVLVLTIALLAVLATLPFASLVYGLYGAFEVYPGRAFRYWQIADWIESRGVRIV